MDVMDTDKTNEVAAVDDSQSGCKNEDLQPPKDSEESKESEGSIKDGSGINAGGDADDLNGAVQTKECTTTTEVQDQTQIKTGESMDEGKNHVSESPDGQNGQPATEEAAPEGRAKRVRKSVEQWEPEGGKKRKSLEELEVIIPEGRGTTLGDIPFLKQAISQNKDSELLALAHRFVFGTKGRVHIPKGHKEMEILRSHLFKFSGYLPVGGGDVDKDKLEKMESEQEVSLRLLSGFLSDINILPSQYFFFLFFHTLIYCDLRKSLPSGQGKCQKIP